MMPRRAFCAGAFLFELGVLGRDTRFCLHAGVSYPSLPDGSFRSAMMEGTERGNLAGNYRENLAGEDLGPLQEKSVITSLIIRLYREEGKCLLH